jgi:3-oxoacyl-[acyl-carrier protein] reductase
MPHDFDRRTVVVTGVGREGQAGEVVARAFAERGARVILVDRKADQVKARAAALEGAAGEVRACACDLTDVSQVAALAGDVAAACGGRLDALVHMAGGFAASGPVDASDPAVWHRMVTINLTTAYVATRALLPLLRPTAGAIVYFASASALPGARTAGQAAYAAAKSGVISLMRTVADEERAGGVRANALAPTAIRTAENLASMGEKPRYVERDDVADAVLFLCSPAAAAVTGQVIALG